MFLNTTHVGMLYVFVYTAGQMHLPNFGRAFGSDYNWLYVTPEAVGKVTIFDMELTWADVKLLDHSGQRCSNDEDEESIGQCVDRFVRGSVGCRMACQEEEDVLEGPLPVCETTDDLTRYMNWTGKKMRLSKCPIITIFVL